jgi:hypothetical protein
MSDKQKGIVEEFVAIASKSNNCLNLKSSFILIIVLLLISVKIYAKAQKPTKSKYFKTEVAGFSIKENEGVSYVIELSTRKKIKKDMYGTAFFENPSIESSPSIFDFKLLKGDKSILIRSPVLREIKNNRSYQVKVLLYKDPEKITEVNIHTQNIEFKMPSEIAKIKGINLIPSQNINISSNHFRVSEWTLLLDKSNWQEGSNQITREDHLIEYIPINETIDNWSSILTSHASYTHIEVDWLYDYIRKNLAKDCPSFIYEMVDKTSKSIIFEWSHAGCNGNPAVHELRKIVNQNNYMYSISFTSKNDKLFDQNKEDWISKFKSIRAIL